MQVRSKISKRIHCNVGYASFYKQCEWGACCDGFIQNIFLNLADGIVYNIKNAKANASLVDLIVYDGSTNATAKGNVHFVSPEGNSLSMKQMASGYKYLKPGTTNEGVQFYTLTGMDT